MNAVKEEEVEMSDKVKKAIDSSDSKVIKVVRSSEKGRVTRYVDRINAILKIDESTGTYKHESISKIELRDMQISLKQALQNVQDLHLNYQVNREEGADETEEAKIEESENAYIGDIENKASDAIKSIDNYNLACERNEKEITLKGAKESYEANKKIVQATLDSDDVDVQRTASIVKEEFVRDFENLLKINEEFLKSFGTVVDDEKNDLTKERLAAKELTNKLDVIIKQSEFKENQSAINHTGTPLLNSTINQS